MTHLTQISGKKNYNKNISQNKSGFKFDYQYI